MDWIHFIRPDRVRMLVLNVPNYVVPVGSEVIDSGDYQPFFLINHLPADTSMIVKFIGFDCDVDLDEVMGNNLNQFFWADASGVTHMKINSSDPLKLTGWGSPVHVLGLGFFNGAKLAKRLKEVVRLTKYYSEGSLNVHLFDWDDKPDTDVDGFSIMSRSAAVKLAQNRHDADAIRRGKITRVGSFRHMDDFGLIKGDCLIISDRQMVKRWGQKYDLVTWSGNVKKELWSSSGFTTFATQHDHNQAMFNVQSASWLRGWLYPRRLLMNTFTTIVNNTLEAFAAGEWPAWLLLPEPDVHADDATSTRYAERSADRFHLQYVRWQASGMRLEQSASLLGMAATGFSRKLQARINNTNYQGRWSPKFWMPLPWSFYGHVMTHEMLELAGYTIPAGAKDRQFYHAPTHSVSEPGSHFNRDFERHGTKDGDDTESYSLRRNISEAVIDDIVFEVDEVVSINVRAPNSDGEYSVHKVYGEFPAYHCYGDMPTIDLANRPRFIEEIIATQVMPGLRPSTRVPNPQYTLAEAEHAIQVQLDNPGVGSIANAMMVYYATFRSSPTHVADTMGNIVDCVQQTPWTEGFQDIKAFSTNLWQQIEARGLVDWYLSHAKVPEKMAKTMRTERGYFTELFSHFKAEANRYSEEARRIGFKMRSENPIQAVKDMTFTDEEKELAQAWINKSSAQFEDVQRRFRGYDKASSMRRTAANQQIIHDMVAKLVTMDTDERNILLLAMYRNTLIPRMPGKPYGISDQALFAPAPKGEQSTMDFFIDALASIGVASPARVSLDELVNEIIDFVGD